MLRWLHLSAVVVLFALLSCGGSGKMSAPTNPQPAPSGGPPTPAPSGGPSQPGTSADICNCTPTRPDSSDYRFAAKHVALPAATGEDVTVAQIVQWPTGPDPASDAPRMGRELQMFQIANAYVQFVWLVPNDCDIHMEISDTPDRDAPRMIVETPRDMEYCPTRQNEVAGLARFGVPVSNAGYNAATSVQVEVLGLAFRDYEHDRGTNKVATTWELHPAIVTIK